MGRPYAPATQEARLTPAVQVVVRARVPLRHMDRDVLAELAHQLEDVFGEGWMN
jgi:hypothetical protein